MNWLLVGAGDISTKRVLPALMAEPRSTVVAVCDLDEGRANNMAAQCDAQATPPQHPLETHFDSTWPIENELRRLRGNFFDTPVRMYYAAIGRDIPESTDNALLELYPNVIDGEELRCNREFLRLLPGNSKWEDGEQKQIATDIADVFDGFFSGLNKIIEAIRDASAGTE